MEKKELRCSDCDYVLIDKNGKETNVLLTLEGNETRYGLCKKCGSFVFVESDGKKIYAEDIDVVTYMILAAIVSGLLDEKGIDLEEVIKEYNEKEKEEKKIFLKNNNSITSYKDVFDSAIRPSEKRVKTIEKHEDSDEAFNDFIKSITRPVEVATFNNEPLKQIHDEECMLKNKYILLSGRHDSWKIFNSEKELTEELSKIPANADILVYELGSEKKLKYNVSLV